MSAKGAGRGLCCVAGRYRRTIGRFTNANGKTAPKKFLLGTDRRAAQLANVRLEQLWVDVTRATAEEDAERRLVHDRCARLIEGEGGTLLASAAPRPREPLWDGEALSIAERIRTGAPNVLLPAPTDPDATERCYVHQVDRLRRRYPSVSFVPGDVQTFQRGQQAFKGDVAHHAARAADAAAIAELPLPAGGGQTLYAALDDYVRWVRETKVKSGKLTPWGKVLAEQVNRLKNAHPDVALSAVDYNALEKIKTYWAGRPLSARCAKPLALDTVRTQLGAARMFVKWLHKNPEWKWRRPDDWEDALKCELAGLMSDDEIANLKRGPESYSVEELAVLYRYATDRERLLILLGLNIGAARAECSSLRIDELDLAGDPPTVKRIRRKTRTYGEFTLWPETTAALRWIATERALLQPVDNKLVIITERGQPLSEHRVANQWNRLVERVRKDRADFRFLPFKFLRKTAAQLVRLVSDGETAGTFLCHGTAVKTDELADVYSRRDFGKVFRALADVHIMLKPMFAEGQSAFAGARSKGSPNVTRHTIDHIAQLYAAGLRADEIAVKTGVSRATAYRRVAKLQAPRSVLSVNPPFRQLPET